MKKAMWNMTVALAVFVLWGNVISLFLPVEDYGAVIKTIDFTTVLFLTVFLIAMFCEGRRKKRQQENRR